MSQTTIEWTATRSPSGELLPGYTFNPWIGCAKISDGCKNCYAEADFDLRKGWAKWGASGTRVITSEAYWKKPLAWDHTAAAQQTRLKVACASLADVFEDWDGCEADGISPKAMRDHKGNRLATRSGFDTAIQWPVEPGWRPLCLHDMRNRLYRLIHATPNLEWLLLTKRPKNVLAFAPLHWIPDLYGAKFPDNVSIGATVENRRALRRIDDLRKIPARVRFLSIEPLLEDLGAINLAGIHWVICGGESGLNARTMHPDWARSIRDQCQAARVPFFFKQWGEWHPEASASWATGKKTYHYGAVEGLSMLRDGRVCMRCSATNPAGRSILVDGKALKAFDRFANLKDPEKARKADPGYQWMQRVGKKAAGRLLDGREWSEFPGPMLKSIGCTR